MSTSARPSSRFRISSVVVVRSRRILKSLLLCDQRDVTSQGEVIYSSSQINLCQGEETFFRDVLKCQSDVFSRAVTIQQK